MPQQGEAEPSHVIMCVHGIRTVGAWYDLVVKCFEPHRDYKVVPARIGWVSLFSFLPPLLFRFKAVAKVQRQFREWKEAHPDAVISIIAHSYGTYAVTEAMVADRSIKVENLVFCGGVARSPGTNGDWGLIKDRVHKVFLNEVAVRDVWPVVAAAFTWGFAPIGTELADSGLMKQRTHAFGHSGYFNQEFVNTYWVPIFLGREFVDANNLDKTPWWMAWIPWLVSKYLWLVIVPVALFLAFVPIDWDFFHSPIPLSNQQSENPLHGNTSNTQAKKGPPPPTVEQGEQFGPFRIVPSKLIFKTRPQDMDSIASMLLSGYKLAPSITDWENNVNSEERAGAQAGPLIISPSRTTLNKLEWSATNPVELKSVAVQLLSSPNKGGWILPEKIEVKIYEETGSNSPQSAELKIDERQTWPEASKRTTVATWL